MLTETVPLTLSLVHQKTTQRARRPGAAYVAFGRVHGTIALQNTYAKWVGAEQITVPAQPWPVGTSTMMV